MLITTTSSTYYVAHFDSDSQQDFPEHVELSFNTSDLFQTQHMKTLAKLLILPANLFTTYQRCYSVRNKFNLDFHYVCKPLCKMTLLQ